MTTGAEFASGEVGARRLCMAAGAERTRVTGRAGVTLQRRFGAVIELSPRHHVAGRSHRLVALVTDRTRRARHEGVAACASRTIVLRIGTMVLSKRDGVVFGQSTSGEVAPRRERANVLRLGQVAGLARSHRAGHRRALGVVVTGNASRHGWRWVVRRCGSGAALEMTSRARNRGAALVAFMALVGKAQVPGDKGAAAAKGLASVDVASSALTHRWRAWRRGLIGVASGACLVIGCGRTALRVGRMAVDAAHMKPDGALHWLRGEVGGVRNLGGQGPSAVDGRIGAKWKRGSRAGWCWRGCRWFVADFAEGARLGEKRNLMALAAIARCVIVCAWPADDAAGDRSGVMTFTARGSAVQIVGKTIRRLGFVDGCGAMGSRARRVAERDDAGHQYQRDRHDARYRRPLRAPSCGAQPLVTAPRHRHHPHRESLVRRRHCRHLRQGRLGRRRHPRSGSRWLARQAFCPPVPNPR